VLEVWTVVAGSALMPIGNGERLVVLLHITLFALGSETDTGLRIRPEGV